MTATSLIKFLSAVILLTFLCKGNCQCSLDKLGISQSSTGLSDWSVTINNPCPCSITNLNLGCSGFQPVQKPDPSVLSINGDQCLVNNGQPVYPRTGLSFNYAWNKKYNFTVSSGQVNCS